MRSPRRRALCMMSDPHPPIISVTSNTSPSSGGDRPLSCIVPRTESSPACRAPSYSMTFSSWSRYCTPFTSTIPPPPDTETLTSCRMVPMPRATMRVPRSSLPRASATRRTALGSPGTGSSAISTRGMPSRSRAYAFMSSSSPSGLAESSSRHMDCTPTHTSPTRSRPPRATSIVLWNPPVLEPSITVFLMGYTSSNMDDSRAAATTRAALLDMWSTSRGGSSSRSTMHELLISALYSMVLSRDSSNRAAGSYPPISLITGRSLLTNDSARPGSRTPVHLQKSLLPVSSCWCISSPTKMPSVPAIMPSPRPSPTPWRRACPYRGRRPTWP